MPPNTVKVDRSTRWGNPMRAGPRYPAAQAVADYARWVRGDRGAQVACAATPPTLEEIRRHLAGKNLACWCPLPGPCHADVLLLLANEVREPG